MRPVNWSSPINWNHPLNRGLVSWWLNVPHWQGGTVWHDLTNRNHGTLTNMEPALDWHGPGDLLGNWGALDFDGVDEHISLGTWSGLGEVTFAALVKFNEAVANVEQISAADDPGQRTFQFRRNASGKLEFIPFVSNSPITVTGDTTLTTDEWWFVTAVNDGTNGHLYVNGVADASPVSTGAMDNDAAPWSIATRLDGGLEKEPAQISVAAFWRYDRGLSAVEAFQLYQLSQQFYPGLLNRRGRRAVVAAVVGEEEFSTRQYPRGAMRGVLRGVA